MISNIDRSVYSSRKTQVQDIESSFIKTHYIYNLSFLLLLPKIHRTLSNPFKVHCFIGHTLTETYLLQKVTYISSIPFLFLVNFHREKKLFGATKFPPTLTLIT